MNRGVKQVLLSSVTVLMIPNTSYGGMVTTEDWWGSVGYTYQQRMVGGDTEEIRNQLSTDINGSYFVWQPWFVTGKLRITLSADEVDDTNSESDSTAIGGNITANVLPLSQFPLSLGYSKSSNDIVDTESFVNSAGQTVNLGDTYSGTSYFITQKYLGTRTQITAGYYMDESESGQSGRYSSSRKEFEVMRRDPHNDVNLKLQQHESYYDSAAESTDNDLLLLTHNYYPSENFSVSNFASKIKQLDNVDLDGDGVVDEYHNDLDQLSSVATWSSRDKKTSLNANARYTGIQTEQQANLYENVSANVGVGGRYSFSENLNANASANYGETETDGVKTKSSSYNAALDYRSDTIKLNEYEYYWGSALEHSSIEEGGVSEDTSTISVNHALSRNWLYGRKGQIRFSADQGVSHSEVSAQESNQTITHGVRLGYTVSDGAGSQYAQASYTESRKVGGVEELSQQVNLQYTRQQRLGLNATLNGSLNHQVTVYESDTQYTKSDTSTVVMSYSLIRNFSFQTLSFNSTLSYSLFASNVSEENRSYTWDNILKHKIGQLTSSLTVRVQSVDDVVEDEISTVVLFNVKRQF